jgi:UDP-N-acetylglucosamine acyltransferase
MGVHPRAIVDASAEIDPAADIGPNAVIEGPVRIGPGTKVYPNAYVTGWTTIGARCEIHPGAVVGHLPQDFHFSGERTFCQVGDETVIREGATVHRGTQPESSTVIGSKCLLAVNSHVAHNCVLGDEVTLLNGALLAGHVEVGDQAIFSALAAAHQFVRIGELAMVGGMARLTMDVPPFMMVVGENSVVGVNAVGLKRRGHDEASRAELRESYRLLYRRGRPFRESVAEVAGQVQTEAGRRLAAFLGAPSRRGICGSPRQRHVSAGAGGEQEIDA